MLPQEIYDVIFLYILQACNNIVLLENLNLYICIKYTPPPRATSRHATCAYLWSWHLYLCSDMIAFISAVVSSEQAAWHRLTWEIRFSCDFGGLKHYNNAKFWRSIMIPQIQGHSNIIWLLIFQKNEKLIQNYMANPYTRIRIRNCIYVYLV